MSTAVDERQKMIADILASLDQETKSLDKGGTAQERLYKAGEDLAKHSDPSPMPGYGQVFLKDGAVWYVGGDGDEDGFPEVAEVMLREAFPEMTEFTYQSEGFPQDRDEWEQVYPYDHQKRQKWIKHLAYTLVKKEQDLDKFKSKYEDLSMQFNQLSRSFSALTKSIEIIAKANQEILARLTTPRKPREFIIQNGTDEVTTVKIKER